MKRITRLTILLFACAIASSVSAATHYISSSAGLDTNNGTSKVTAWLHAPGMTGCSNNCSAYVPQPGDRIILKGGDTWNNSNLTWSWTWNGSSGNPIYIGVDTTWYSGTNNGTLNVSGTTATWASGNGLQMNGSWTGGTVTINGVAYTIASIPNPYILILTATAGTQSNAAYTNSLFVRPIIDGQGLNNGLVNINASYVIVDSLEITGQMTKDTSGGASLNVTATNGNVTAENMDIHNWNRCTGNGTPTAYCTSALTDNSGAASGIYVAIYAGLSPANLILQNSNVGTPETGGNIGSCSRGFQQIISNYLHDCPNACDHGCSFVHDNILSNVGNTFDGTTHTDGFYSDAFASGGPALTSFTAYIYNNWIMNTQGNSSATVIYPNPGSAGVSGTVTYYVFNNVITNTGPGAIENEGDAIDPYLASGSLVINIYDWNNTYDLNFPSQAACVNVVSRPGISLNIIDVRNLHCIANLLPVTVSFDGTSNPYSADLLPQTVATANGQGYLAPMWNPTSPSPTAGTVGRGTDLSAYCSGQLAPLCNSTTLGGYTTPVPRGYGAWDEGAFQYATSTGTLSLSSTTSPGLRAATVYPNPVVPPYNPTIRICPGIVDSVDVTIFDVAGHVVNSGTVGGGNAFIPAAGVGAGFYCYEYTWTGHIPSGAYFAVVHAKSSGTTVKARVKFAVIR